MIDPGTESDLRKAFRWFNVSLTFAGAAAFLIAVPLLAEKCDIKVARLYSIVAGIALLLFVVGAVVGLGASMFGAIKCAEAHSVRPWPIAGLILWVAFCIGYICMLFGRA
jgi:uncharacterized membrane protein